VPLFPETHYSIVSALRSDDAARARAAGGNACIAIRSSRPAASAAARARRRRDLRTSAHAFERDWLQRYDRSKGRFRTFLRLPRLRGTRTKGPRASSAAAGDASLLRRRPAATDAEVEAVFGREWVRSVFERSLEGLRQECEAGGRQLTYDVFVAYDIEGADAAERPNYAQLASRFAIPATQVTNYLNWARRALRRHVLDTLRALTASDEEFRDEARALLGVEVG
jgi:hypothetical protein